MPRSGPSQQRSDLLQLAGIGIAGGAFAGLFGVGGGIVMVPLLILWRGYEEKLATGTSLAAIVIIAAVGVAANGIFGSVDVAKGLLIGMPAVVGVVAGTAVQQKLPDRALSGLFAALLLVVATVYVL